MPDPVPFELTCLTCNSEWIRFRCSKRDCEDLVRLMSSTVSKIKKMVESVISDRIKRVYDKPESFSLLYGGDSLEAYLLFDISDVFTPIIVKIRLDKEKCITSTPVFKPEPKHRIYENGLVMTDVILSESGKMKKCNVGIFPEEEGAVDMCEQKEVEQ